MFAVVYARSLGRTNYCFFLNLRDVTLVFRKWHWWPGCCSSQGARSFSTTEGIVSHRTAATLLAAMILGTVVAPVHMQAQQAPSEEILRRAKTKVQPAYPEIARKMGITGTVKIEVVVSPNGAVKEARVVGGHPVLANAALEAAKKWRFETASSESTGVIDFKFEPR